MLHTSPFVGDFQRDSRETALESYVDGRVRATFDEKRNIFRFQDRAKNPMQSLARVLRRIGVAGRRHKRSCTREDATQGGAKCDGRSDPIQGEARRDKTRRRSTEASSPCA